MTVLLEQADPGFAAAFARLVEARREEQVDVREVVRGIVTAVQRDGDGALIALTEQFDRLRLTATDLRLQAERIAAARRECAPEALAALEFAAARIRAFHERQLPEDATWVDAAGIRLGLRWSR